jgi:xanthine dehydrogenase small subunit
LAGVPVHTTLLDVIRDSGLTGCKEGCAEGECGACAVLVARPGVAAPTEWVALNACLVPAAAFDGQEVLTAEGLGQPGALHPVQREMAVRGGSQCGYCTPGFVCSMAAEYYRPDRAAASAEHSSAEHSDADDSGEHGCNGFDLHALSGNLCRCTGYRPIRDAAYALGVPDEDDRFAARGAAPAPAPVATELAEGGRRFVRPATLADALQILHERPDAIAVAGCTDWGVEVNLRGRRADDVVAIDRLSELRELTVGADVIEIGAALTLTEIERRLDGQVPLLADFFPQFGSRLIRNGATLGGNLGTCSPIGDSPPVLLALDARLVLADVDGEREVALADYFTDYRQSVRRGGELIRSIRIPLPLPPVTAFHKIAKRRFDDISSVAVAFGLELADGAVRRVRIGLGGVAATPIRAYDTEAALTGRPWTLDTVRAAAAVLQSEGSPLDDHRASARYRAAMLGQSLLKLHAQTAEEVPA